MPLYGKVQTRSNLRCSELRAHKPHVRTCDSPNGSEFGPQELSTKSVSAQKLATFRFDYEYEFD